MCFINVYKSNGCQVDMHGNPIKGFTEENIKTKSSKHFVFHRERCPLQRTDKQVNIPSDFEGTKPWFFMKTDGCRTALGWLRGYPMIYSPGYATAEEALQKAEEWEATFAERKRNGYREPSIEW